MPFGDHGARLVPRDFRDSHEGCEPEFPATWRLRGGPACCPRRWRMRGFRERPAACRHWWSRRHHRRDGPRGRFGDRRDGRHDWRYGWHGRRHGWHGYRGDGWHRHRRDGRLRRHYRWKRRHGRKHRGVGWYRGSDLQRRMPGERADLLRERLFADLRRRRGGVFGLERSGAVRAPGMRRHDELPCVQQHLPERRRDCLRRRHFLDLRQRRRRVSRVGPAEPMRQAPLQGRDELSRLQEHVPARGRNFL